MEDLGYFLYLREINNLELAFFELKMWGWCDLEMLHRNEAQMGL